MVVGVNGYTLDFTDCSNYGVVKAGEMILFRGTWSACVMWAERH